MAGDLMECLRVGSVARKAKLNAVGSSTVRGGQITMVAVELDDSPLVRPEFGHGVWIFRESVVMADRRRTPGASRHPSRTLHLAA